MRIEQKLAEALREDAEGRDVDVTALWAETLDRIEEQGIRPRRRRRIVPFAAAAAAAVAAVAVGLTGLAVLPEGDVGPAGAGRPQEGGVDDEFTCPEQIKHDWTRPETVTDDYFVASLRGGPEAQARRYAAARYEFEEAGERAFLRFGNADGSLATLSEFRLVDGEWTRYRSDVCVGEDGNIAAPVEGAWELGNHGGEPYEDMQEVFGPRRKAYLVDHRPYYDPSGLLRHRSIWAADCERSICLVTGNSMSRTSVRIGPGTRPADVSPLFLPPSEISGRNNPYGLWALYDVEGTVASLEVYRDDDVPVTSVQAFHDGWPGQLHLVLAPVDQAVKITVIRRPGSTDPGEPMSESFSPEELRQRR